MNCQCLNYTFVQHFYFASSMRLRLAIHLFASLIFHGLRLGFILDPCVTGGITVAIFIIIYNHFRFSVGLHSWTNSNEPGKELHLTAQSEVSVI